MIIGRWWAALLGAVGVLAAAETVANYREVRQKARAAYEAKDYAAYSGYLKQLRTQMHGHPSVVWAIAGADALLKDRASALRELRLFASMGLLPPAAADPDLSGIEKEAGYAAIEKQFRRNGRAITGSRLAFTLSDPELIPEDLAFDATTRSFYFSSILLRKIVKRTEAGVESDFVATGQDGMWSAFGLAIDAKRRALWVSTAATSETRSIAKDDVGRSAVLLYDIDSRKLVRRYEVPRTERGAVLGDIAVDSRGDLIVGDAFGMVYRARRDAEGLEAMVSRGELGSAQQPVPLADGRVLIADYTLGIGAVNSAINAEKKTVTWLPHPENVAVNGIDGLYEMRPGHLLGIQNGTNPVRIIEVVLDGRSERITAVKVREQLTPDLSEPTHAVRVGAEYYFIANSGSGKLAAWEKLAPARVYRMFAAGKGY